MFKMRIADVVKVVGIIAVAFAAQGGEAPDAPRGPVVTIICGGHSNWFWRRKAPRQYTPGTWAWDHRSKRWRPVRKESGPDRLLIDALAKKYPGVDFAAIELAKAPSTVQENWQPDGDLFREALKRIEAARKAPQPAVLAGFVTMLGWCECLKSRRHLYPTFQKDYSKFVSDFRGAVGQPELPWIASRVEWGTQVGRARAKGGGGLTPPMSYMSEWWQLVNSAFDVFPKEHKHLVVIPSKGIHLMDGHHFSSKGDQQWVPRAMQAIEEVGMMGYAARRIAKLKGATPEALKNVVAQSAKEIGPASDEPVATVRAVVVKNSKGRAISKLGPYKHALLTTEYEVIKVLDGKYEGTRIIAVHFGIKDRKYQPARNYKKGDTHDLKIGPWDAQEENQRVAMDDGIEDLDSDRWFVFECKDSAGARKPSAGLLTSKAERLLETADTAEKMGQRDAAKALYRSLVTRYPKTEAAKKAIDRLEGLQ